MTLVRRRFSAFVVLALAIAATAAACGGSAEEVAVRPPVVTGGNDVACLDRLSALGVRYEVREPIVGNGRCGISMPIHIVELQPGLLVTPHGTLNCRTTEALALWARDVLVPAAERHLDARPTAIVHDSLYVCRNRNNSKSGKLSQHAFGNAIDIRTITISNGESVPVIDRSGSNGSESGFQREIRLGACTYFSTVLGPGANRAHATHFHFDTAQRSNGYRLCQ